jgi:hypothetical protein
MKPNIKLTKQEKEIDDALSAGEFVDVENKELKHISQAIARRKKRDRTVKVIKRKG